MISFESSSGYLPDGIHRMPFDEFASAFGWNGRRRLLLAGLARAVAELQAAGCRAMIVDGSFVTSKDQPGDWDAAFDPVGVDAARLDPILLRHDDDRRSMRAKYLGDLFPWGATAGDDGATYLDFFRKDRSGVRKGVVELKLAILQ